MESRQTNQECIRRKRKQRTKIETTTTRGMNNMKFRKLRKWRYLKLKTCNDTIAEKKKPKCINKMKVESWIVFRVRHNLRFGFLFVVHLFGLRLDLFHLFFVSSHFRLLCTVATVQFSFFSRNWSLNVRLLFACRLCACSKSETAVNQWH